MGRGVGGAGAEWRSSQAGFADGEPRGRLTALQLVQTGSAEQTRPPRETSLSLSPVFHRRPSSETEARRLRSDSLAAETYTNVHRPLVQFASSVSPPTDARAGAVPPACQRARHPHGGDGLQGFSLVLLMGRVHPLHGRACLRARRNEFVRPGAELVSLFFFFFFLRALQDCQPRTGGQLPASILGYYFFFPLFLSFFRCSTKKKNCSQNPHRTVVFISTLP